MPRRFRYGSPTRPSRPHALYGGLSMALVPEESEREHLTERYERACEAALREREIDRTPIEPAVDPLRAEA